MKKISVFGLHSFDWYVYYADGCYGNYPAESPNYHGQYASCINPEHDHSSDTYICGDADRDGDVTILDTTVIQRVLVKIAVATFDEKAADTDGGSLDITDATWIQRNLADIPNPHHIGETIIR